MCIYIYICIHVRVYIHTRIFKMYTIFNTFYYYLIFLRLSCAFQSPLSSTTLSPFPILWHRSFFLPQFSSVLDAGGRGVSLCISRIKTDLRFSSLGKTMIYL